MESSPKVQTKFDKDLTETKIFQESPGKKLNSSSEKSKNNGSSIGKEEENKSETNSNDPKNKETTENDLEREEEAALKVLAELTYKCQFHDVEKMIPHGLTFDDVLLIPQYSRVDSRKDIYLETRFSKNVPLRIPLVSSPMDTVTEYDMAVAMARMGGLGIIHRFMKIKEQARMVEKVKSTEAHVISSPICVHPNMTIKTVKEFVDKLNVNTFLVIKEENHSWIPCEDVELRKNLSSESPTLSGILTKRDINYASSDDQKVSELMTPKERLVIWENISEKNLPTPVQLIDKMKEKRVEKIILISEDSAIIGLVCLKDCLRKEDRPWGNLDKFGRLHVGAAVGAKDDYIERSQALIDAGVDVLVVDVANGHSQLCIDAVKTLKAKFPDTDIVAGSVATGEGAEMLIKAGADGIRCGIGNGSICITRVVTGAGIPQLSALFDVAPICRKYNVPLISDGGNRNSGNMCKALAAGADCIMLGRLVAGCDESPSKAIYRDGKLLKVYRGMAGFGANVSKSQRMGTTEPGTTYTPEGVEGYIPYAGPVRDVLIQFDSGIRSGMSYCGAFNFDMLKKKAKFIRMTQSGFHESGVHDIKKIE